MSQRQPPKRTHDDLLEGKEEHSEDERQSRRIEQRNAQILDCKKDMRGCKDNEDAEQHQSSTEKLSRRNAKQRREMLLAALEREPYKTWLQLTADERRDKELVLKAATCKAFLPWMRHLGQAAEVDEIPLTLRGDKEVMLAVCGNSCWFLEFASPSLRDDPDFVLAVLKSDLYDSLEQLEHASDRLKGNRDFIFTVISYIKEEDAGYGDDNLYDWLKFIKLGIEDEKKVASKVICKIRSACDESTDDDNFWFSAGLSDEEIQRIRRDEEETFWFPRVLEMFSPCLRDDKEFMLQCVSYNWKAMEYCSDKLKACDDIVKAATSQSKCALKWALGSFRDEYLSKRNKASVLKGLSEWDGMSFDEIPEELKGDIDIALALLKGSATRFEDLPEELRSEKRVILAAAQDIYNPPGEDFFALIPNCWKKDEELAMTMFRNKNFCCPGVILEHQPALYKSKEVALAITKMPDCWALASIIGKFSFCHDDEEVMLAACKNESDCFKHVSERLLSDRSFVDKVLTEADHAETGTGWVLAYLSTEFCKANVDLVVRAIEQFEYDELELNIHLLNELWDNKSIVMACLHKGLSALEHVSDKAPLSSVLDDEEVVRTAVRVDASQLKYATSRLKSDRSFVLQVVGIRGGALEHASFIFRFDNEVFTVAVANDADTILQCFTSDEKCGILVEFASRFRGRICLHRTYIQTFLCGMSVPRPSHVRCPLTLLNRGSETSTAFKRLIAEYLGVPLGKEVGMLRSALSNLAKLGY